MKKAMTAILVCLTMAFCATTAMAEDITSDTTWSGIKIKSSDVNVLGAKLTINAGTYVLLGPGVSINVYSNEGVPGEIDVNGTLSQRVRFLASGDDPWGCLIMDSGDAENEIQFAIFDGGGNCEVNDGDNIFYGGMVSLLNGELDMTFSMIRYAENDNNEGLGLFVGGSNDAVADFTYTYVYDNSWMGVMVSGDSTASFDHCYIYNTQIEEEPHQEIGLYSYVNSYTELTDCNIHDNPQVGIVVLSSADIEAHGTTVADNGDDEEPFNYDGTDYNTQIFFYSPYNAKERYWDFNDSSNHNTVGSSNTEIDVTNVALTTSCADFQNVTWTDLGGAGSASKSRCTI